MIIKHHTKKNINISIISQFIVELFKKIAILKLYSITYVIINIQKGYYNG